MRTLSNVWKRFVDESGAFAVYAAVALPVLVALIGSGLDYWTTLSVKSRLDAAADTAAVAGVRAAVRLMKTNPQNLTGAPLAAAAQQAGQAAAIAAFTANGGPSIAAVNAALTPNPPAVVCSNGDCNATVSYSAARATSFASLVGFANFSFTGRANATQHAPVYINMILLVDNSQSMGLASTQADMNTLWNLTTAAGRSCVFACHNAEDAGTAFEPLAEANNVKLRIDSARQAIQNMAQQAISAGDATVQFYVYTMQQTPDPSADAGFNLYTGTLYNKIFPPSGIQPSDYLALYNAMSDNKLLHLGDNVSWSDGDSNQMATLSAFAAKQLPPNGDGSSPASAINYVFIVTDGIYDYMDARPAKKCKQYSCARHYGAIPSTACDAIKATGAKVGLIYTTYLPIYADNSNPSAGLDGAYVSIVQPFVGYIPGNLKACSSDPAKWYYEAADDVTIKQGMSNLFQSAVSLARMTQ